MFYLRSRQLLLLGALCAAVPAWAQRDSSFRANIRGNGSSDSGKCTIEVRVDEVAEVEFSGDQGRLHTISGQPASWTRIDCSAPMPQNMKDFRFTGVDGRGRQTLIQDPRNNGGIAVVRIEDPKNGVEGYTFDLTWKGGNGYGNSTYNNGSGNNGYYNNGGGRDRDRDRGNGYGYGNGNGNNGGYGNGNNGNYNNGNGNRNVVRCSSDGSRQYCNADTSSGVTLLRQDGESCRQGETWGYDRRGIWVDRGCRGVFSLGNNR